LGLFGRKKDQDGKTTFKCQYCDMKFDDKERMKRHMRKAHSEKGGGDMPSTNPFGFG
jgi:uncharacterized C2H2 Zn-finger protein